MDRHRFVILGTDTEVGKTCVACGLARAFMEMGHNTIAIKPVETGCQLDSTLSQDGARLAQATGQPRPRLALHRFREPVAPPVAAEKEGRSLIYSEIISTVEAHLNDQCISIIEGAGGLLSPLTWEETMLDMVRDLDAQVILVCADRLGTLNHTRMALQILAKAGLPVAAVVMSEVAPNGQLQRIHEGRTTGAPMDRSAGLNLATLERVETIEHLIYLPYVEHVEEAAAALRTLAGQLVTIEKTHDHLA